MEVLTELQEKHYDFISAIRHLRKTLPLTLRFHHVKGHQDRGQITVLSREASMNVEMDEEAKWKVSTDHQLTSNIISHMRGGFVSLRVNASQRA